MSESQRHLSVQLKHRAGVLQIDVAFELTQPWTVLFGPSGSGKSTILRAIAGLIRPEDARVIVRHKGGEQIVDDSAKGVWVRSHDRAIRWTAQRPALFPHMTVLENLRFAAPVAGAAGAELAEAMIERFHLTRLADRRPGLLSGGEQQRVSIARVVCSASAAREVGLLLLDEPFSGLDAPLRDELLQDLRGWLDQSGTRILSVTHDVGEAFLLGAEVVRLDRGRVTQHGPAGEVLAEERARLRAQLNLR